MANTLKFGDNNWALKDGSVLAYNDENNNFKPLPFDFTRATIGTRVNKSGLIETMQSGIPRIDYTDNTNGHLLLEPQRTNLFTESNDYTGWNGYQATSNTTNAPDGSSVLFLDFEDVRMFPTTTISTATEYTSSIYLKANKVANVKLRSARDQDTIISLTTDWVRYELTATSVVTSTNALLIDARFSQGLGASGLEIALFGGQIEEGSYATSIIPTSGASVTRNADTLNFLNTSNIIGQSEGTLFFDANFNTADSYNISLSDSSSSNYISIDTTSDKAIFARVQSGGATQATINTSGSYFDNGDRLKCAIGYKANDFAFYINGTQIGTDTSGSVPTTDDIRFARFNGSLPANQSVNEFKLYNTRLSNNELATLTTL